MSVRILVGDVRARLDELPNNHYQTVVTSPPYFGLRDYSCAGQIGLEPTLAGYLATLVDVFRAVRRVLRDDGTLWLNIGDSYAGGNYRGGGIDNASDKQRSNNGTTDFMARKAPPIPAGLKPKDLMLVPARLAIALVDDGWYLRSDIIWHKKAPMPESVTDRPTSAHEHIFLLTKAPKYFYDATAVAEQSEEPERVRLDRIGGANGHTVRHSPGGMMQGVATRNLRNVWTLSPEPFPAAHFATFPTEIPRRCIKAGTSEKGCCAACGAPWWRVVVKSGGTIGKGWHNHENDLGRGQRGGDNGNVAAAAWQKGDYKVETTGWEPGCACGADVRPCLVLDCFAGSGTTGLVADELGRDCTLIELSPEYARMSYDRIYGASPMFASVEVT